ncbi:hypothetical protein ACN6AT_03925 [Streptomyces sp. JL4002]|uniref:hypothetical protein n=1 Tax=Streptomyces TaxID=1883 RepID=UPI0005E937BB|nr:hypothetical protein SF23_17815 [Streptomyces sp. MBRL 10]
MLDRVIELLSQTRTLRALLDFCTIVVRLLPALVVVIALVPSFFAFAFISAGARRSVLEIVDRLTKWTLAR